MSNQYFQIEDFFIAGRSLPENIFTRVWGDFRFFDSDLIFDSLFVEKLKRSGLNENSHAARMLHFSGNTLDIEDSFSISFETTPEIYQELLIRGNSIEKSWMYSYERFACIYSQENIIIYYERNNELAVMATNVHARTEGYYKMVNELNARPISEMLEAADIYIFQVMAEPWKRQLKSNFG